MYKYLQKQSILLDVVFAIRRMPKMDQITN